MRQIRVPSKGMVDFIEATMGRKALARMAYEENQEMQRKRDRRRLDF